MHNFCNRNFRISNLFKSILRLFKLPSKTGTRTQAVKGISLIVIGFLFAFSAHQWSANHGAKNFDSETWPRKRIFDLSLSSFGFKKTKLSADASLLENHPEPYKLTQNIWVREDFQVIYISSSPYQKAEAELWVKADAKVKGSRKLNWLSLTPGITAFNSLIRSLDELKPISKIKAFSRNLVDPKEIRY